MGPPPRYFAGLSKTKKRARMAEIRKYGSMGWRDPAAYVGFVTDRGVRTRTSKYTRRFRDMFPRARTLKQKAAVTGVPLRYLQKSYDRGMAAWRTGHRPGATQQQWGYGRVHSFLTCGKTYHTTDSDLATAATAASRRARVWWDTQCPK